MTKVGTEPRRAKMLAANLSEADYRGTRFNFRQRLITVYIGCCDNGNSDRKNEPPSLPDSDLGYNDPNFGM